MPAARVYSVNKDIQWPDSASGLEKDKKIIRALINAGHVTLFVDSDSGVLAFRFSASYTGPGSSGRQSEQYLILRLNNDSENEPETTGNSVTTDEINKNTYPTDGEGIKDDPSTDNSIRQSKGYDCSESVNNTNKTATTEIQSQDANHGLAQKEINPDEDQSTRLFSGLNTYLQLLKDDSDWDLTELNSQSSLTESTRKEVNNGEYISVPNRGYVTPVPLELSQKLNLGTPTELFANRNYDRGGVEGKQLRRAIEKISSPMDSYRHRQRRFGTITAISEIVFKNRPLHIGTDTLERALRIARVAAASGEPIAVGADPGIKKYDGATAVIRPGQDEAFTPQDRLSRIKIAQAIVSPSKTAAKISTGRGQRKSILSRLSQPVKSDNVTLASDHPLQSDISDVLDSIEGKPIVRFEALSELTAETVEKWDTDTSIITSVDVDSEQVQQAAADLEKLRSEKVDHSERAAFDTTVRSKLQQRRDKTREHALLRGVEAIEEVLGELQEAVITNGDMPVRDVNRNVIEAAQLAGIPDTLSSARWRTVGSALFGIVGGAAATIAILWTMYGVSFPLIEQIIQIIIPFL